jgi:SET domain-containing protein
LKLSSIKNSGLGVFSLRNFKVGEFITAYLGEVNENSHEEEYTFKKINGKPVNSESGFLEDYWFGHRIQHGSGDQVNVFITAGYEIKAKKDIEIDEELFMDYNRSIVCEECKVESDFYDRLLKIPKKCNFCENMCLKLKKCSNCEACFICLQCYDKKQITF